MNLGVVNIMQQLFYTQFTFSIFFCLPLYFFCLFLLDWKAESIYNEEDEGSVDDEDLEALEEGDEENDEEEQDAHTSSIDEINNKNVKEENVGEEEEQADSKKRKMTA